MAAHGICFDFYYDPSQTKLGRTAAEHLLALATLILRISKKTYTDKRFKNYEMVGYFRFRQALHSPILTDC